VCTYTHSFAKETYNLMNSTNRSHPMCVPDRYIMCVCACMCVYVRVFMRRADFELRNNR